MRAARLAALALASFLALAAPSARAQLGLAGTYTGTYSCRFNEASGGAAETSRQRASKLVISELAMSADGEQLALSIDDVLFSGRVFELGGAGSGHGLGAFARCGSTGDAYAGPHTSVQRVTWRVNTAKSPGRITVDEIFNVVSGAPGAAAVGTCKGTWTRVLLDEPNLPACQ